MIENKNCIFTICAKNYIGLANVLKDSIKSYYDNFDFFIFVADELPTNFTVSEKVIEFKQLNLFTNEKWIECAFKYTVTEFCTLLKPYAFQYLFSKQYEKILYFDPDIAFFSSAELLFNNLTESLIELTPHFITTPKNDISKRFEDEVRFSGIFNLGFLGLRASEKTLQMLDWWGDNLLDKGFADFPTFQFTDQKWMDFMPLFFHGKELCVLEHLGCNIAPWNFFERKVIKNNENLLFVSDRNNATDMQPVIFVHFSGFNYKKFMTGDIIQNNDGHDVLYEDTNYLLNSYQKLLISKRDDVTKYLDYNYSYNTFDNDISINSLHRRFYRAILSINDGYNENPFFSTGKFYKMLARRGMLNSNSIDSKVRSLKQNNGSGKKIRFVNNLFFTIYRSLGFQRYFILMRFLRKYSIPENQIFLLDKSFNRI